MGGTDIRILLPTNVYQALINANAPTSVNPYATIADLSGFPSGSGTLNFIPKWTPNGTTLGNSRIFDDGTRIGIGTSTPKGVTDIPHSSANGILIGSISNLTLDSWAGILTMSESNGYLFLAQGTDSTLSTNYRILLGNTNGGAGAGGELRLFSSTGATTTRITGYINGDSYINNGTGFFGIGTNAPVRRFHVSSAVGNTTAIMRIDNTVGDVDFFINAGTPEAVITGSPTDVTYDLTNGRIYLKVSGAATNTGWKNINTGLGAIGGVAYWDTVSNITSSSSFLWDEANIRLTVGGPQPVANVGRLNVVTGGQIGSNIINTNTASFIASTWTEDATHYGGIQRLNSTFAGNFTGSSIPNANMFNLFTNSNTYPIMISGSVVYIVTGGAGNFGQRTSATGTRIDRTDNLHTAATAKCHYGAGTTAAGTAPEKYTSGPLMTSPEVGAFEFLTDRLTFTGTTGTTRKDIADFVYRGISALRTLDGSDEFVNCTANTFTVTLPTAVGFTKQYVIANSGTGVITLATTSSQTISGSASGVLTLVQWDTITLRSDGANWIIIT